jgi:hypothetical protein
VTSLCRERRWLLTADRVISNFFHPRSAAKKKALREKLEREKNPKKDSAAATNTSANASGSSSGNTSGSGNESAGGEVEVVLQVGMELKHRKLHTYARITRLDAERRLIHAVECEPSAGSAEAAGTLSGRRLYACNQSHKHTSIHSSHKYAY